MDQIKSIRTNEHVFLRFINSTAIDVDVIWINFTGSYVNYKKLPPGSFVDVNTYKQHPWIALDHKTHDRLRLFNEFMHIPKNEFMHIPKNEFVYIPKTFKECIAERFPGRQINIPLGERRMKVIITLPVYSLRYRTLLGIRSLLKVTEDVDQLELPKELKEDLKRLIQQRNTQVIHPLITIR